MKEFQALGLDLSIIDDEGNELNLKQIEEDESKEDLLDSDDKMLPQLEPTVNEEINDDYLDEEEEEDEDFPDDLDFDESEIEDMMEGDE